MSERTLKRMVVVLAVLVLAWVVATITRGGPPEPGQGGGPMAERLDGLEPEAATAIVFAGGSAGTETVRLERAAGATGWTVDDRPADSALVARFLTSLDEAGTGAPVSVNPANHARMGVDEASARVLVVEGPEGADTLLVGDSGPTAGSVYARLPGADPVHVVSADLSSHARRSPADWRSRRMATVDTAGVTAVEVTRDGATYRLERGDSVWTVDGGPADGPTVRSLLGELASLQAQAFADDEPPGGESGSVSSTRSVTARDADGRELLTARLWEADEGATSLEAIVTGPAALQPDVRFTLPSWRADRLAPASDAVTGDAAAGG